MRQYGRRFLLIWLWLIWSWLGHGSPVSAESLRATVLWYQEQEAGGDPWQARYIVTPEFLRSDEGDGSVDFMLLDRRARRIYSVVEETRTVLEIDGSGELGASPGDLVIDVRSSRESDAPRLEGHAGRRLELRAGGDICYSSVVVDGLLDEARRAFEEFAHVLAVQQQSLRGNTPEEFITPCFLARYIYAADFDSRRGLPVVGWAPDGARRQLLRYERDVPVDAALFVLPGDYERYQPLIHPAVK